MSYFDKAIGITEPKLRGIPEREQMLQQVMGAAGQAKSGRRSTVQDSVTELAVQIDHFEKELHALIDSLAGVMRPDEPVSETIAGPLAVDPMSPLSESICRGAGRIRALRDLVTRVRARIDC